MKQLFLTWLLLTCPFIIFATDYTISSVDEFNNLNLSAGDTVTWLNGTYNSDERIKFIGSGTASNPITLKAETPGGVVFNNGLQMDIAGNYLIVDGFYWQGGYGASNFIQFRSGTTYATNSTIQNCAINGLRVNPDDEESGTSVKHRWIVLYGDHNNVINCSFMNKNNAGAIILAEYEYNAATNRCTEVGHTITNNYFYNFEKIDASLSNAGDSETIRIGTSEFQNVNSGAIVSGNYFVQADGENEIITNKSANNTYTNNTFRRCRGSLVMRHGANATVNDNYFLGENVEGTGAIRIADSDHTITNNYIQDCVTTSSFAAWNNGLTFVGGNTSSVPNCTTTSVSNAYQDVENITFSNNTFINTDSPIYFNASRDGADNVYGTVSDNVIYFDSSNDNVSDIISGSYSDIGNTLTFSGNVYEGTTLGESVSGFSNTNLTATNNGEIYSISGASDAGASISSSPLTDNDVSATVGACFLDASGNDLTGCDGTPIDSLNASTLSTFGANEEDQTITVTSNVNWTVSESSSWISINTTSGSNNGAITVSASENTATTSRSTTVTISGGGITRTISISQDGIEDITESLNISTLNTFGADEEDQTITVTSNVNWTVSESSSWISVSTTSGSNNGSIVVSASENTSTSSRATTITVSDGDITRTISISQDGVNNQNHGECTTGTNLSLNATVIDYSAQENTTNSASNVIDGNDNNRWSANGFPQYVTIDLGETYRVNEINLISFNDRAYQFLVEGSSSSASGYTTLTDATDNSTGGATINRTFNSQSIRYVKLTITGASGYSETWSSIKDFEIICAGTAIVEPFLSVTSLGTFTADGENQTIDISSNVDWSVSESSSWISVNTINGSNDDEITITADENTSTIARSTSITISGGGITRSVSVYQEGAEDITIPPNDDNLALNGTASQSTTAYNGVASRAIDGNTSGIYGEDSVSHTSPGNVGSWWQVELQEQTNIGNIVIYNRTDCCSSRLSNFTVTIYDDSNNEVYSSAITTTPNPSITINADNVSGKTVRITTNLTTALSLAEVEVYAGEITDPNTSCTAGTNLALNGTIVDFSTEQNTTNTVSNIIDGDDTNRWSAEGYSQYAVVDLGDQYTINEINLSTFNNRDYQFTVEGSSNFATSGFSTLVDASDNSDSGLINRTFTSQTVRYVKLTITGANSYTGSWISISDFEIICAGNAAKEDNTELQKALFDTASVLNTYPNPFSNFINITSNNQEVDTFTLVDISGKSILKRNINSNQETINNLDNLSSGIYIIQFFKSDKLLLTKKLIKN